MGRPKKESVSITKASPHTIKKFELIEYYVDAWARKILGYNGANGREGSKGLIYIDCMSNSGLYHDNNGNLVDGTALRIVKALNNLIENYPTKKAIVLFNDIDHSKIELLKAQISTIALKDNIEIYFSEEDCNVFLHNLNVSDFTQQYQTLLLYDPYIASLDWSAIDPFLNRWGEVIINHMISDTKRGITLAKKEDVKGRYQTTYDETNIARIIDMAKDKKQLNDAVIRIIQKRSNKAVYIASFSFFNQNNSLVYDLIHCSSNLEGFKLIKKSAWKTFGDKSSLKDTHGTQNQLRINLDGTGCIETETDDECYYVSDIAKDIIHKFGNRDNVTLGEIYRYLDIHPIFPSDGYKDVIKNELRDLGVKLPRSTNGTITFPNRKEAQWIQ